MKRPPMQELVKAVAEKFSVSELTAHVWLIKTFVYHKPDREKKLDKHSSKQ